MNRSSLAKLGCLAALLLATPPAGAQTNTLPEGLVCGLSYLNSDGTVYADGRCNGVPVVQPGGTTQPRTGFQVVHDGDSGFASTRGWVHWRFEDPAGAGFVGKSDTDPSHADLFILPKGAVCGLHHTFWTSNATGKDYTCMNYDPGKAFPITQAFPTSTSLVGCPPGQTGNAWVARKAFDMSSGSGYWVWCEYQDPNGFSYNHRGLNFGGIMCGLSHNNTSTGNTLFGTCAGVPAWTGSGPPNCSSGNEIPRGWFDDGQASGVGLGGCEVNTPFMPPNPSTCAPHTCATSCGGFDGCGNPCGVAGSSWCTTSQQCTLPADCPPCSSQNCTNGCCNPAGACDRSESSNSCGLSGVACFSCPAGTHCSGSSCVQDFDCNACECGCNASATACAKFPTCSISLAGVCRHQQLSCVCSCGGCDCE